MKIRKPEDVQMNEKEEIIYQVDTKLLKKVEKLCINGYKNEQKSIMNWFEEKGLKTNLEKI